MSLDKNELKFTELSTCLALIVGKFDTVLSDMDIIKLIKVSGRIAMIKSNYYIKTQVNYGYLLDKIIKNYKKRILIKRKHGLGFSMNGSLIFLIRSLDNPTSKYEDEKFYNFKTFNNGKFQINGVTSKNILIINELIEYMRNVLAMVYPKINLIMVKPDKNFSFEMINKKFSIINPQTGEKYFLKMFSFRKMMISNIGKV